MPKHYMYPDTAGTAQPPRERFELHWQRDGGVQLASTQWAGTGAPITEQEVILPDLGDPMPAWSGKFIGLGRNQLNHLIKQLRVARDQAYGRDE